MSDSPAAPNNSFSGPLTFMRCPAVDDVQGADVAILGVPFDAATTNRSGARLGPRAIRLATPEMAALNYFPDGFDVFETLNVVDAGDVYFHSGYPATIVHEVRTRASEIIAKGARLLSLGGDHFVSYPLLKAHAEVYGPLSLIHFDAHSDTWPDDGEQLDHGSMFLRAARDGIVDPASSVQVGIRTANDHTHGYLVVGAPWVHRHPLEATVELIRSRVGDGPCYVTFDIDALDPAHAPGTGTPVPGGLTTAQSVAILRGLRGLSVVGADVVEVAPAYDHAEITALAGATIAMELLANWAVEKGARPVDMGPDFLV